MAIAVNQGNEASHHRIREWHEAVGVGGDGIIEAGGKLRALSLDKAVQRGEHIVLRFCRLLTNSRERFHAARRSGEVLQVCVGVFPDAEHDAHRIVEFFAVNALGYSIDDHRTAQELRGTVPGRCCIIQPATDRKYWESRQPPHTGRSERANDSAVDTYLGRLLPHPRELSRLPIANRRDLDRYPRRPLGYGDQAKVLWIEQRYAVQRIFLDAVALRT